MAKFTRICASQDDLFALDEDGNVYPHTFNTKTWVHLPQTNDFGATLIQSADRRSGRADLRSGNADR